ncbi:hypothetical protein H632_c2380p0, partial [Helicosporidium sp. ATCC 50920]
RFQGREGASSLRLPCGFCPASPGGLWRRRRLSRDSRSSVPLGPGPPSRGRPGVPDAGPDGERRRRNQPLCGGSRQRFFQGLASHGSRLSGAQAGPAERGGSAPGAGGGGGDGAGHGSGSPSGGLPQAGGCESLDGAGGARCGAVHPLHARWRRRSDAGDQDAGRGGGPFGTSQVSPHQGPSSFGRRAGAGDALPSPQADGPGPGGLEDPALREQLEKQQGIHHPLGQAPRRRRPRPRPAGRQRQFCQAGRGALRHRGRRALRRGRARAHAARAPRPREGKQGERASRAGRPGQGRAIPRGARGPAREGLAAPRPAAGARAGATPRGALGARGQTLQAHAGPGPGRVGARGAGP